MRTGTCRCLPGSAPNRCGRSCASAKGRGWRHDSTADAASHRLHMPQFSCQRQSHTTNILTRVHCLQADLHTLLACACPRPLNQPDPTPHLLIKRECVGPQCRDLLGRRATEQHRLTRLHVHVRHLGPRAPLQGEHGPTSHLQPADALELWSIQVTLETCEAGTAAASVHNNGLTAPLPPSAPPPGHGCCGWAGVSYYTLTPSSVHTASDLSREAVTICLKPAGNRGHGTGSPQRVVVCRCNDSKAPKWYN